MADVTRLKRHARRTLLSVLLLLAGLCPTLAALAPEKRAEIAGKLCAEQAGPRLEVIEDILRGAAASVDDARWGKALIVAAGNKTLLCGKDVAAAVRVGAQTLDAATLQPLAPPPGGLTSPFVNLRVRASLDIAAAQLTLLVEPAGGAAESAVDALERNPKLAEPTALEAAVAAQTSAALKERLQTVQGIRLLQDANIDNRLRAIGLVAAKPTQQSLTTLMNLAAAPAYAADPKIKAALDKGIYQVRSWLQIGDALSVLFSGLSYASILFLAALGLAIIFGLMGVINLAQGELIMVGAYATYFVQEALRAIAPGLLDLYLLIAIPVAFLLTAGVGLIMEWTIIRHLYRRPLVTLLATWAVSLLLINIVRVAFGTQNLEFVTPSFLAGGERVIGDFIVTWNRVFAIGCALATFVAALLVLKSTRLGLYIRAVTANRDMAGCVGVSARKVDLLSFGIGSGLAGVAGLVLSPIYSVNPTMGSNFIVDAFMIVVLGGVGSIVGTLVAAISVGMVNVAIEPVWGAVAAKVIVLLMIIVFIQFRPEGMFVVRGRK
jgi:urea transport system permease protein